MAKPKETVMIISDLQVPFHHKDSIPFLKAVEKKYRPTRIIQIGDLIDSHALGFFDSDPDGDSAGVELKKSIKDLKKFYKAFPKVDVTMGNHDARLYRSAFAHGIPRSCVRDLPEILEFPAGWRLDEEFRIDGVIYEHGDKFGSGSGAGAFKKAIESNMASTVFGHFHSNAGVLYAANKRFLNFGFNVGCLMDTHSYAAAYGKRFPAKPILSCGIVDKGIPQLIPMLLTSKSRWVGTL